MDGDYNMFIYVTIDRDQAILAGQETFGRRLVEISIPELTLEQRSELIELPLIGEIPMMDKALDHKPLYSSSVGYKTPIIEASQSALARALTEYRASRLAHKAAVEEDKKARRATIEHFEKKQEQSRLEQDRKHQAEIAEKAAHKAALLEWIEENLSDIEKKRYHAGLMSKAELNGMLRDEVFLPLEHLFRYERITASDWTGRPNEELEFCVRKPSGCTDSQFLKLE